MRWWQRNLTAKKCATQFTTQRGYLSSLVALPHQTILDMTILLKTNDLLENVWWKQGLQVPIVRLTHIALKLKFRVLKYAKFGAFYARIVQMTPLRLRRKSLRLQIFSVTNREPLWLQKFAVTNTVLSLPFSQQIQFTLIVNVVNLN